MPTEAAAATTGTLVESCEPSAMSPWNGGLLVGDNEVGTKLFAFDLDLSPRAPLPLPVDVQDIEALATWGSTLVVVGSHSRNKEGKPRPGRERILLLGDEARLLPLDLAACPGCAAARSLAPNEGGFNIEGALVIGGALVLGLRGPLAAGKAQLLSVDLTSGAVTGVVTADLGGEAFRELVPWKAGFLAVSGPVGDPPPGQAPGHHLWWFPALGAPPERLAADLPTSTEAIYPLSPSEVLYLVDGDGKAGACATPGTHGRLRVTLP